MDSPEVTAGTTVYLGVTGGTRGIGRAIVDGFVAEGAHVAFCAHRGELGGVDQRGPDGYRSSGQGRDAPSDVPAIVTISSVSGREVDFASGPYGWVIITDDGFDRCDA